MSQATTETTGETTGATGQVLEFTLGSEAYCVDIDYVTEIVDVGELTDLPNAPPYVEGVMDLRGRTTAIVDPKVVFGIDGEDSDTQRIVVFDPEIIADRKATGWLVDDVRQVAKLDDETVEVAPEGGAEAVRGVIRRDEDEGFTVWVDPQAVHK